EGWILCCGGRVGECGTKFALCGDADIGTTKDDGFAWQLIAGFGYNISDNIELGLKYRYFQTKFSTSEEFDFDGLVDTDIDGKIHSHSVLASVIFSFAPPPPPP